MTEPLSELVRQRAGDVCEYCRMPQRFRRLRFQVDHIVATQHGGSDELENLALACGRCNRHKGPNLSGVDAQTSTVVRLFNPRTQVWSDHFLFIGARIEGRSPEGRATVATLAMNHPHDVAVREEMILSGITLGPA